MAKVRLGVALVVPHPLDREIDTLRRATGDGTFGRVPAHLTLVPPVNVREDRMGDALAVLRAAAAATRPFRIRLGSPTTFLPDNPVLYLPVEKGAAEVVALRERVFRDPLARPLTWPFVPHVTVADEADPSCIAAAQQALAGYRTDVSFDRVHLLQEGPGRVWAPVADAALGAPAVVGRGGLPVELWVGDQLDPEAREFSVREWHALGLGGLAMPLAHERVAISARREDEVTGVATGWTRGEVAHLCNLVVGAPDRGQGIGSRLLAAFHAAAVERGCRQAICRAQVGSQGHGFLQHRGWREDVRLPRWFDGRDYVELRREL
ncbi:MAG TPA: GNAT family N-acetyltransferase [Acidimicrobiales bacterium]|nr:GNAT family N-acetyltransferase [Acidimicrobiales bacterium]